MTERFAVVSVAMLLLVGTGWASVNPGGRFGISQDGVTTCSGVPAPVIDLQVREDGAVRWIWKTHDIDAKRVAWLLESKPEVLIIGLGWSG